MILLSEQALDRRTVGFVLICLDKHDFEVGALTSKALLLVGRWTPIFAIRMAPARAVLIRALAANLAGKGWRHVGQVFLPLLAHLVKHPRQKLCWQGAWMSTMIL
jgi:hypothetical protein